MPDVTQAAVKFDSAIYTVRMDRAEAASPGPFGATQPNLYWSLDTGYAAGGLGWKEGQGPIGTQWNFAQVVHAGLGILYAVQADGILRWYRHRGSNTGIKSWAKGSSAPIGNGFHMPAFNPAPGDLLGIFCDSGFGSTSVLAAAAGATIYAVRSDGALVWFRHQDPIDGTADWANGGLPKQVGEGWVDGYRRVFSGGNGIIYLIGDDGQLWWYRHRGHSDGTPRWDARKPVGSGWADFLDVFSIGGGHIYALAQDEKLWRYRHNGYATGSNSWSPKQLVRSNWSGRVPAANSVLLERRRLG